MNRGLVVALAVVVLAIGGYGVYRTTTQTETSPTPSSTIVPIQAPTETMAPATPAASTSATIVSITAAGFEPKKVTVKAGDTVTWTNNDTRARNVSSDDHPTHKIYPTLNVGKIDPGMSKTLTFPTAGSYDYHDHIYSQFTGTVVVQ